LAPQKGLDTFFSMVVMLMRLRRSAGIGAVVVLCAGCFSYVPAELGTLSPEHEARLELTRIGFAQLPEIPNNAGPELSGTMLRRQAGQLFFRVPVAIRADGMVTGSVEQDVVIPESEILRIEQRVFSMQRTAVVAAGGIGVLIGVAYAFGSGGPPVGQEPEKPIDEEAGSGPSGLALTLPLSFLFR
jgi:hypothetical protein